MGVPISLILIAAGAILTWAVTGHAQGIDVQAVGVILMVVGLVTFLLSLLLWHSWWGPGYFRAAPYPEGAPVRRRYYWPYRGRRRTYVEDHVGPPGPPAP
jgi:hypothetical protein